MLKNKLVWLEGIQFVFPFFGLTQYFGTLRYI